MVFGENGEGVCTQCNLLNEKKTKSNVTSDHKIAPSWNRHVTTSSVDDERNNERERGS